MREWIKNRWKNGLNDPMSQNIVIYFCTYIFSMLLSFIMSGPLPDAKPGDFRDAFFQTLISCILPATVTMVLSTAVQNYAAATRQALEHSGQTLALVLSSFAYVLLYVVLNQYASPAVSPVVYVGSALLAALGLSSIAQIERETAKANKKAREAEERADKRDMVGGSGPAPS